MRVQEGNCVLCGTYGKLTFEHIPPRITFNKHTRYRVTSFLEVLEQPEILNTKVKGKVHQGGIGYYVLCSKCNSFLGTNYVPEYNSYSNSFIKSAQRTEYSHFKLCMHEFEPLKVLKQIAAMFLCVNGYEFAKEHPELVTFVRDTMGNLKSSRYRFFNYVNYEGELRYLPLMMKGNFTSGEIIHASEIAFPPLGHVLCIDFDGQLPYHFEITNFGNAKADKKTDVEIVINRLLTYSPIMLDYRDKQTLEADMKRNQV